MSKPSLEGLPSSIPRWAAPLRATLERVRVFARLRFAKTLPPASPVRPPPLQHPANPLIEAATPLLALLARLSTLPPPGNLEEVRQRIIAALRRFQSTARSAGILPDQMRAANFILSAALDDAVASTPWGAQAGWRERGLLNTFHQSIAAGPALATLLGHMHPDPQRYRHELELAHLCIALGLNHPPDAIAAALRRRNHELPQELSPSWRGDVARRPPLWSRVPPWVLAGLAAIGLTGLHLLLSLLLRDDTERLYQHMTALLPDRPAVIVHREPALVGTARTGATLQVIDQPSPRAKRLGEALAAEAGPSPEIFSRSDGDVVRIGCGDAFGPAGDALSATGHRLIERLAALIDGETGQILVVGHTDTVVPRNSRNSTALTLSEARARAAARVLVAHLALPQRVDIEGRADTEPLVTSRDTGSRARNCRIEVVLAPDPATPAPPAERPIP